MPKLMSYSGSPGRYRKSLCERPIVVFATFAVVATTLMINSDHAIGVWMAQFPAHSQPFVWFLTHLGEGVEVLICAGVILLVAACAPRSVMNQGVRTALDRITAPAAFVFFSVSCSGVMALTLKLAVGRARPTLLHEQGPWSFRPFAMHSDFASFPSGHSATAAAIAISLALLMPPLRSMFICLGILICISRQLVGMHWMSDTVMGWGVGAALTYWLAHRFARKGRLFRYDDAARLQLKYPLVRYMHHNEAQFTERTRT